MHCLAESNRIIIVGIPGVGKTTVVSRVVELLKEKNVMNDLHFFQKKMTTEEQQTVLKQMEEIKSLIDIGNSNNCGVAICGAGNGHTWALCPDIDTKNIMIDKGSKYAEYVDIKIDHNGLVEL